MPDLSFSVVGVETAPYAATPLLVFKLAVENTDPNEQIHSIALQCQIRIEVTQRHYSTAEQPKLLDLFGEPERWSQTLRNLLWTHANVTVRAFQAATTEQLPVTCTFDFNVAATKYFSALESGVVPVSFLFSGTVFYEDERRGFQVAQIPWSKEARYPLPVDVWRRLMDLYYPNSAWMALRRDVFDRLHEYKRERGLPTWEQTIESLLAEAHQKVSV